MSYYYVMKCIFVLEVMLLSVIKVKYKKVFLIIDLKNLFLKIKVLFNNDGYYLYKEV